MRGGARTRSGLHDGARPSVSGCSALSFAAEEGHTGLVRLLLEARARTDDANLAGQTPLILACSNAHAEAAQALIEARASLDVHMSYSSRATDGGQRSGQTALSLAAPRPAEPPTTPDPQSQLHAWRRGGGCREEGQLSIIFR